LPDFSIIHAFLKACSGDGEKSLPQGAQGAQKKPNKTGISIGSFFLAFSAPPAFSALPAVKDFGRGLVALSRAKSQLNHIPTISTLPHMHYFDLNQ
jgi:hypothetical protein